MCWQVCSLCGPARLSLMGIGDTRRPSTPRTAHAMTKGTSVSDGGHGGYEVPIGDPHNDQIAAAANEQLTFLLASTSSLRMEAKAQKEDYGEAEIMAIIATSLAATDWSKIKMSSVLAAALLRLTKDERVATITDDEVAKAIDDFLADPSTGTIRERPDREE